MFLNRLIVSTVSLLLTAMSSFAVSYYVSPNASAGGTGTITSPFQTIAQARDAVKALGTLTEDANVYLRAGMYTLTSTLTFDATNSGSGTHNVIYQAYPGETPVISGGQRTTGWALSDAAKNIYSVTVGTSVDTRQLYVNGVRAARARSVDGSGWSPSGAAGGGTFTCPSTVSSWGNITNIEVAVKTDWRLQRSKLSSVSGTTATGNSYAHAEWQGPNTVEWVENAYELLDAEGEWYLNRSTGILYYKPRATENMSNAEVIMAKVETLISGTNVTNLQFKGITFSHATWLYPNANGFSTVQADNCNGFLTGNISFTGCSHILFDSDIFTHLGQTGLRFTSGNNMTIYNCTFQDISGSAISLGTTGASTQTTYNTINNNLIRNCAVEYQGCVGIFVLYTENTVIIHNEIHNMPYSGISMGWGWSNTQLAAKNCEIAYNLIDTVMSALQDGGGIYTLSNQPGTMVHDNYIHKVGFNASGQNGLYPDEGSSHMHWYNNVVSGAPRFLHMWINTISYDTVENNWYDGGDQNLQGTNCIVRNNTLVSGGNWPAQALAIIANAGRTNPTTANLSEKTPRPAVPGIIKTLGGRYIVTGNGIGDMRVELVSAMGEMIGVFQAKDGNDVVLPKNDLPHGMYLIRTRFGKVNRAGILVL